MQIDVEQDTGVQPKLCILIADDHKVIAGAVARLLLGTGRFETSIAGTFDETMRTLSENDRFDLVLLDIRMPGMSGLDSVQRIVARAGDAKVVLFSGEADRRFVTACVKLGVRGFIPKSMPLQSFVSALNFIVSGEIFLPADIKTWPVQHASDRGETPMTELELSILRMAGDGMTNKMIAVNVNTNEANVKMHMRNICQKLNAKNRTHAAIIARNLNII